MSNELKRPPSPILIFDIETITDIPLIAKERGIAVSSWHDYHSLNKYLEENQISFLPTIFQTVLSICAIFIDPESFTIINGFKKTIPKVSSYEELLDFEKKHLKEFWSFCLSYKDIYKTWYDTTLEGSFVSDFVKNKIKPIPLVFCGYNISSFDLLVLDQRSLIHLIECPIHEYARDLGPNSYRYKYASDKVFDLINFVSNFDNRNARPKLNTLAQGLGLSGKLEGMEGSKVNEEYYSNNKSELIEEYCSVDVLITYAVFLSVQKFRGLISDEKLKNIGQWFYEWLKRDNNPQSYKDLAKHSESFFTRIREL